MIKWGCIQPLLGGIYFGVKEATKCDAQWIISYPGLNKPKYDKDGNVTDAGNEHYLTKYLKEHNCLPPYYTFNRTMFQNDTDLSPTILDSNGESVLPDYNNMDLVVAVPVCSGLSTATIASDDVKMERNLNMIWIAKYTLNIIKPKVYIFENAPTLMSARGKSVRHLLESIASSTGYSVAYYKTDTVLHNNCQKRPRTFVLFFKSETTPKLGFEKCTCGVEEFLNRIPDNSEMHISLPESLWNTVPIKYAKYTYGDNWRDRMKDGDIFSYATKDDDSMDKFLTWLSHNGTDDEIKSFTKYINHIKNKRSLGKGWWIASPRLYKSFMPACMYKNIWGVLHYKEDRLYNCREWLSSMGMPYDFNMEGEYRKFAGRIGQNVPVGTAKFIASQAIKFIDNKLESTSGKVVIFDNVRQTIKDVTDEH